MEDGQLLHKINIIKLTLGVMIALYAAFLRFTIPINFMLGFLFKVSKYKVKHYEGNPFSPSKQPSSLKFSYKFYSDYYPTNLVSITIPSTDCRPKTSKPNNSASQAGVGVISECTQ